MEVKRLEKTVPLSVVTDQRYCKWFYNDNYVQFAVVHTLQTSLPKKFGHSIKHKKIRK